MKTVILCGGTGTRMKEETEFKPKPLVLVGGKPILWHIMKVYAHYGYNDFVIALGYKGDMIKDYFLNWRSATSDFTLNTKTNDITFHNHGTDDFNVTFVDTGLDSLTGERILRVADHLKDEQFMVTYGDGVGDVDICELVKFHNEQGTKGTITGVRPSTRFGLLNIDHNEKKAKSFFQHKITDEEDRHGEDYINGGFMVFNTEVLNLIEPGSMIESVFPKLSESNELSVHTHGGKWKCMDTYKDVEEMNKAWVQDPFWKVWN